MITKRTNKKLEDVARDFEAVSMRHGFGVLGVHDLRAKMVAKGLGFTRGCMVFEVCNPGQARKVLDRDIQISTALPCRISAYEVDGGVELATMEPTQMIGMFGHTDLAEVASGVETSLRAIMEDVAR